MERSWIWYAAKACEGIGLTVVLWGLVMSMNLGMQEDGLKSMAIEGYGLMIGGGLFLVGWLIERRIGSR
jgi:hypothetical protein